ncbi:hypothetical protein [Mycobacterium sp. IEC1808]|uniref:hypothetical protein n=1 Tax=Mycobacterium sp. IEC1808 TaxID=1743230 RepID=UPI00114F3D91|nr:hypothetical protein [Mycobacterium sp. IEC1808]
MTTTARDRRRRLRIVRLALAGAATLAMLALFNAARPDTTHAAIGPVRLTDVALSAPAAGPVGGFAADDDDWAQQQEQQQEQFALQQMQQSMQQAEQQNEAAQQQFLQDMQQAQTTEQQANNP